LVYGSHTEQAYSSDGPTEDLYACSLTVVELMLMFLWRNPSVLFAFVVIFIVEPNLLGLERLGPKRLGAGTTWGRSGLRPDQFDTIQNDLHKLSIWEQKWKMAFDSFQPK
jgi:hypothetical protein